MSLKQPQATISWTACHKFDKLFYAKYETGKLTINEYMALLNLCIVNITKLLKERKWYQFKRRRYDKRRLKQLQNIKNLLTL